MRKKIDIETDAINLVYKSKTDWDKQTVFVTDKVGFDMRNLIRVLRKNFWGVFDEPTDPITQRPKVWVPLSASTVKTCVKSIDLDTKDINFRAKNPKMVDLTYAVRQFVKNTLDDISFGEILDKMEVDLAINGTAVWKTIPTKKNGLHTFDIVPVDLLNFYIDPLADSINDDNTTGVIERIVMPVDEVKSHKDWMNTEDVNGSTTIHPIDSQVKNTSSPRGEFPFIEVYEYWGKIPKYFITGKAKDEELIEGHMILSGTSSINKVHLIEVNNKGYRPYTEFWYNRVPGRWFGRGPVEELIMLQSWINTVVNLRINRSYVEQLGLMKVRKGAGVTAQMLGRLASNGVIQVQSMDDIEPLVMQSVSASAFNDENNIQEWAQKVTQAYESVTGESLPASTSATQVATQSRSAMSGFAMVQKGIGMGLQRWIRQQVFPIIKKNLNQLDILRVTMDVDLMRSLDEKYATRLVLEEMKKRKIGQPGGPVIDPQLIENERQRIIELLQNGGDDRYFKDLKDLELGDFDVEVYITNEEMDTGVMQQNIIQAMQMVSPDAREQLTAQLFDMMGIKYTKPNPQIMAQQAQMAQMGPGAGIDSRTTPSMQPNMAQQFTQANTLEPNAGQ